MSRISTLALVLITSILLFSCAGEKKDYSTSAPDEVYNDGMDLLNRKAYRKASDVFNILEKEHPYSSWAIRAKIMEAYSLYSLDRFSETIAILEDYLRMHPNSIDAPYAQYLLALSHYEQITDVARDQNMTQKTMSLFKELIAKYPESIYARDAQMKLDLVVDHLAGKEMEIGRFYYGRGDFTAAINRFNTVVTKYSTTSHVEEALFRLTEVYSILGVKDEAEKNAAVLGYNYPASKWYKLALQILRVENKGA